MVTVNTCTTSATSVLKLIADKIGQATDGRRSAVMQELISQLSGSNRLIIIDEADRLSLQALQAIRDLNDQAHVGSFFLAMIRSISKCLQARKAGNLTDPDENHC